MATSAVVADLFHHPSSMHPPSLDAQLLTYSPPLQPRSPPRRSSSGGSGGGGTCVLPYIDSSRSGALVKNMEERKTTPPSFGTTNDFLPPELVLTLRQQGVVPEAPPRGGSRLPTRRLQPKSPGVDGTTPPLSRPPANVWNHSGRRGRLRYLTDHPPCICGAGRLAFPSSLHTLVAIGLMSSPFLQGHILPV